MKPRRKMGSVVLVGRRWFNCGSTYHSCEIILDGKLVHKIDYTYGYGNQYEWNAWKWLEANGYAPGREHSSNGSKEPPFSYCECKGIVYTTTVTDVSRKKDL